MARIREFFGTILVSASGTTSTVISDNTSGVGIALGRLVDLLIEAPDTLTSASFTVQVSTTQNPTSSDYSDLSVGGTLVTGSANQAVIAPVGGITGVRVVTSGAEASDRTFRVSGQVDLS